jgi:hypothetical protein
VSCSVSTHVAAPTSASISGMNSRASPPTTDRRVSQRRCAAAPVPSGRAPSSQTGLTLDCDNEHMHTSHRQPACQNSSDSRLDTPTVTGCRTNRTHERRWSGGVALSFLMCACGGGTLGSSIARGSSHRVHKSVTFQASNGPVTVLVDTTQTAAKSPAELKDMLGERYVAKGIFMVVNVHIADSNDDSLELRGGDRKLYEITFTNCPDGVRDPPDKADPTRCTVLFDVPVSAASGAVLLVHEPTSDWSVVDNMRPPGELGATSPPGYYDRGVDEINLGT